MRSFECRELVTEPKCRISLLHLLICKTCWNCPDHTLFLPFIYRRRKSLSWPILFPLSWSCIRCKQVKCQFNVSASYYTYGVVDVKAPWQFSRTSFISTFAILYDDHYKVDNTVIVLIKSSNFISFVPRGYRLSKQRRLSSLLILLVVEVLSF